MKEVYYPSGLIEINCNIRAKFLSSQQWDALEEIVDKSRQKKKAKRNNSVSSELYVSMDQDSVTLEDGTIVKLT
jgi:hypothetical protein